MVEDQQQKDRKEMEGKSKEFLVQYVVDLLALCDSDGKGRPSRQDAVRVGDEFDRKRYEKMTKKELVSEVGGLLEIQGSIERLRHESTSRVVALEGELQTARVQRNNLDLRLRMFESREKSIQEGRREFVSGVAFVLERINPRGKAD